MVDEKVTVSAALGRLDPENDEHWTADGLPRVEVVSEWLGAQVSRQEITNAAPKLTRQSMSDAVGPPTASGPADVAKLFGEVDSKAEPTEPGAARKDIQSDLGEPIGPTMRKELRTVLTSPKHLETVLVELNDAALYLQEQKRAIDERLRVIYAQSELASRHLARWKQAHPEKEVPVFAAFARSEAEARAARAGRITEFVGKSGVRPEELAKQLQSASPLDAALAVRRSTPRPVQPPKQ
jgi:hypothetical protein